MHIHVHICSFPHSVLLQELGNPVGLRQLDVGLRTTKPLPEASTPAEAQMQVVVERARHLGVVSGKNQAAGSFCIIQAGEEKVLHGEIGVKNRSTSLKLA